MNTYDQIVASAYYVFGNQLNTRIISAFLIKSTYNGNVFEDNELQLNLLKDVFIFDNYFFRLNNGYSLSDIEDCINFEMVTFFQNLKKARDNYYSGTESKQKKLKYKRGI